MKLVVQGIIFEKFLCVHLEIYTVDLKCYSVFPVINSFKIETFYLTPWKTASGLWEVMHIQFVAIIICSQT